MTYSPSPTRYDNMKYNRCGNSGLKLPAISLGLWHNFGEDRPRDMSFQICRKAFDLGITHFDLANNYGIPAGSAETTFGEIMRTDFANLRDEIIISTKAGYLMWPGPYGEWGSRKYVLASLDQSLKRMGVDYVDIFYSHRFDPDTPLEETMGALDTAVRQGKALYAGVSSYTAAQTREAVRILKELGTPCIIHQPRYSIFDRWTEDDNLFDATEEAGMGSIVFSPLEQGMLTNKYLGGIPAGSRASENMFLKETDLTQARLDQITALDAMARDRGQSLAQMALAWVLRDKRVTSALIGASRPAQVVDCVEAINTPDFTTEELATIDKISK